MCPTKEFPNISNYNESDGSISDYCTSRGFPLGGIGTGGFNILTDGGFGKFRTNHNWFRFINSLNFPRGTFFAIRTQNQDTITTRILRRNFQGGKEFVNITNIEHTKFIGKIPHFTLIYHDANLPVQVETAGFTSLIPQNLKDSSLPIGNFSMKISNPTETPQEVSILFSFENLLGLGGSGSSPLLLRDGPLAYRSTKGNYCENFNNKLATGLIFKTKQQYRENNPRRRVLGNYYIYTELESDLSVDYTSCTNWSSKQNTPQILSDFHCKGNIKSKYGTKQGNSGALCVRFQLAPSSERTINFYFCWWTPYYVIEKQQRIRFLTGRHKGKDYGHYYLNFFSNPLELIIYSIQNRDRMDKESRELEGILAMSTLPNWLQTYILNSSDSILVNTCLGKDGIYYMIEGCPWDWLFGGLTGTIDMRLASHPYSSIFLTEFDKAELLTFRDLTVKGEVPHGNGHCDVMLNSSNVPYGKPIKFYNKSKVWTDLPQSFILQFGKLVMITGEIQLLRDSWEKMIDMMEFIEKSCIDGIPDGITTYDYANYNPHFIYSAVMQLATLTMMQYLGKELINSGETSVIKSDSIKNLLEYYQKRFEFCELNMYSHLWEEKGYFKTCSKKNTIFTSALAGDWVLQYCGLSPNVDLEKARSHNNWQLEVLFKSHNHIVKKRKQSRPLIYREADLEGQEIPVRINLIVNETQANNPYQTLAYLAFETIYLGRVLEGLDIIKRIWDKGYYEGYPWDMNHWGFPGHIYMSHPVMWAIFNTLTGVSMNLLNNSLTFSPRLLPDQEFMKIPVFFPFMWLWVEYNIKTKKTRLEVIKSFRIDVEIQKINCIALNGTRQTVILKNPLKNEEGGSVTFQYPF